MCTCQYLIQFKVAAGLTGYVADVTDSSGSDKLKLDMYWCQCLLEHQLVCNFVLCHVVSFLYLGVFQLAAKAFHIHAMLSHSWSLQPQNE